MTQWNIEELTAAERLLNQEKLLVKKYKMYASACKDPQLRQKCEQVAAQHHDHYIRLLNQLN